MKFKSFQDKFLVVTEPDGEFPFSPSGDVKLNGIPTRISYLQEGDELELTGDPPTCICATRAAKKAEEPEPAKPMPVLKEEAKEDEKPKAHSHHAPHKKAHH